MKYEYIPQPLPGVFASQKPGDIVRFDQFLQKDSREVTAVILYIDTGGQALMRELGEGFIWWRDLCCLHPAFHVIAPPTLPLL